MFIDEKREGEVQIPDLNRPSLAGLIYKLRHPELDPEGFVWDYRDCKNCAMGLSAQTWSHDYTYPDTAKAIGIDQKSAGVIFTQQPTAEGLTTRGRIADLLERC